MNVKHLIYATFAVGLLSSCSQLKRLSSRDNSARTAPTASKASQKPNAKKVRFLDNISVAPGQTVTSKHAMGPAMPTASRRKQQRDSYNEYINSAATGVEIERADWLQLKYAILLDATVETLTNVSLLKLIDEWYGTSYCLGGSTKNCID